MKKMLFSLAFISMLISCRQDRPGMMVEQSAEDRNIALIRYFFEEVYNSGNVNVADSIIAEDYVSHNKLNIEALGPEGIKKASLVQRATFSNWKSVIDEVIAQGDKVAVRGHDEGDFTGEFLGIPPNGNHFYITWIDIFRIEDGKLKEAWLEIDSEEFRNQLTQQKSDQ